jgi:hypothetical protein
MRRKDDEIPDCASGAFRLDRLRYRHTPNIVRSVTLTGTSALTFIRPHHGTTPGRVGASRRGPIRVVGVTLGAAAASADAARAGPARKIRILGNWSSNVPGYGCSVSGWAGRYTRSRGAWSVHAVLSTMAYDHCRRRAPY